MSTTPPAPSTNLRSSTEVPRIYADVRHSIDIVQRAAVEQNIKNKPTGKVLKKAEKKAIKIEEHRLPISQCVEMYGSNFDLETPDKSKGLTKEEADRRLQANGPNALTPPKGKSEIRKFLDQFMTLFAFIPIFAGLVVFITYFIPSDGSTYVDRLDRLILAILLYVVVIFNGVVAYHEERKGEKILAGFAGLGAASCRVVRDGELSTQDVKVLVVGDIVKIKGGDKLPADVRVLSCNGFKVDNASLTGEQEAQSRSVDCTHSNPLETKNLMFYGTLCIEGEGYGIVIRTGDQTVIGQIANLASTTKKIQTPLQIEINRFVKTIAFLAIVIGIAYLIAAWIVYGRYVENLVYAIGLMIANVPQGLLPTVTMLLTLSAQRLGKKNVVVKKLQSVETLGSTDIICSDKTGTLTQNRMTVVDMWFDGRNTGVNYDRAMKEKPADAKLDDFSGSDLSTIRLFQECIALCNRTVFEPGPENQEKPILDRECIGDASETALLKYVETRPDIASVDILRDMYPKIFEIPFNSKNKWQLSIHKNMKTNGPRILFIKGAPERVMAKCQKIRVDGKNLDLDEEWKDNFQQAYEYLASKGERVLGFGYCMLDPEKFPESMDKEFNEANIPTEDYVFLGLTGLMDPPKVGVPEAIEKCKSAGIQVVMVTGDHPATAKAIAKQIGIITGQTREDIAEEEDVKPEDVELERADAVVVHGEQIDTLKEEEWSIILRKKQVVFARTSPQQKLEIVERFQRAGHIVAVTGDGVNDSPALKKADLGISMNITGSDVSKEAAALILLDDNFASIVNGIEEGRLIFDNLKKSIAYTITHCTPEIVPFLLYVIVGFPLPVTSVLIIFIDLGTELVVAISLAYEKAEADIMNRMPRPKTDPMVSFRLLSFSYFQMGVIETLGCFTGYFIVFMHYGIAPHMLPYLAGTYFQLDSPDLVIGNTVYTAAQQLDILRQAQSAYFVGIVMIQWGNIMNCKTRINSLFMQGIFNNPLLWIGMAWAAALTCCLFYIPGINNYLLKSYPLPAKFWVFGIPWIFLIIIVDEIRKFLIRRAGCKFLLY